MQVRVTHCGEGGSPETLLSQKKKKSFRTFPSAQLLSQMSTLWKFEQEAFRLARKKWDQEATPFLGSSSSWNALPTCHLGPDHSARKNHEGRALAEAL